MISLLPFNGLNLFNYYCNERCKDDAYRNAVELSRETLAREDCDILLLVGKVQSGKTAHFIGLTLRLFDSGFNTAIVFSGTKLNLHNQTFERFYNEFKAIGVNVLSGDDPNLLSKFNEARKNVIVCLKHSVRIERLAGVHIDFGKVLIIDDESDQASLNGRNKDNVLSGTLEITPTHQAIQLLLQITSAKYLQITATPAGHLLTGVMDYFRPNYILGLKEHSNYFGNKVLFENENNIIKWMVEDPTNPTITNIVQFVVTHFENSLKLLDNDPDIKNISAFMHPHSRITILKNYYRITKELIELLSQQPAEFVSRYNLYLSEFFKQNIDSIIERIVKKTEITLVAGKYDRGIIWEDYFSNNRFFILVGGGKLERGFTIEGLISTFMPRSQKVGNADTIQQRARFFGSKRNLVEYISLFVNEKTYNDFYEYHLNEKFIFELIDGPTRSVDFNYNYITDYTNPCREEVLFNLKRLLGTSWRHYYLQIEAPDFIQIIGKIGYRKEWKELSGFSSLIFSVEKRGFLESMSKLEFLTFKDELSNKFGFLSTLELVDTEELQIVVLGNEVKYRERTGVRRDVNRIPEMVHQGYSTNYPGDRNLYFSKSLTLQLSFVELTNFGNERLTVLSVKSENES